MAKEYIDREAVSEGIRKYYYKNPPNSSYQEGFDRGLDKAQRVILDAPVADVVEVRPGKWIHPEIEDDDWGRIFHKWTCSVCGYSVAHNPTGENYCPNCGAKMGADTQEREDA